LCQDCTAPVAGNAGHLFCVNIRRRQPLLELDGRRRYLRRPWPGLYLRTPYAFRRGIAVALCRAKASGCHIKGAALSCNRGPLLDEELPATGRRSIKTVICSMAVAGNVRRYTNRVLCRLIPGKGVRPHNHGRCTGCIRGLLPVEELPAFGRHSINTFIMLHGCCR
jgi:hypothetical protein